MYWLTSFEMTDTGEPSQKVSISMDFLNVHIFALGSTEHALPRYPHLKDFLYPSGTVKLCELLAHQYKKAAHQQHILSSITSRSDSMICKFRSAKSIAPGTTAGMILDIE